MCPKKREIKNVTLTKIRERGKANKIKTSAEAAKELKDFINKKNLSPNTIDKAFAIARMEGKKTLLYRHVLALKLVID